MQAKITKNCFLLLLLGLSGFVTVAQPTITSFTPTTGKPGDVVTITGTNFNTTAANNQVRFGALTAVPLTATATQLTVAVPTGATIAPITVLNTTTNLLVQSTTVFTPIYGPSKGSIGSTDISSQYSFGAPLNIRSIAVADFDGDGLADISSTGSGDNFFYTYRNTTVGSNVSFASPISGSMQFPISTAAGDLDGDGKPDVVFLSNNGNGQLVTGLNTSTIGNISFTYSSFNPGNNLNSQTASLGDLDGDGKLDLVLCHAAGSIAIYKNQSTVGNISFAIGSPHGITVSSTPINAILSDLDSDGKLDIVVPKFGGPKFSIYKNTTPNGGAFSFDSEVSTSLPDGGSNFVNGVTLFDVDNDGKNEILATYSTATNFYIYPNTSTSGTISFATPVSAPITAGGGGFNSIDIDGDGKLDLVMGISGTNNVHILRNNYNGTAIDATTFQAPVSVAAQSNPTAPTNIDLNNDGLSDLLVGNFSSATFSGFINNPAYTWYSKASGATAIQALSNWGFNANGSGVSPTSFSGFGASNDVFQLANATSFGVAGALTMEGTLNIPASTILNIGSNLNNLGAIVNNGTTIVNTTGSISGLYNTISGSGLVKLQAPVKAQRGWRIFANPFTTSQSFSSIASANNINISTINGAAGIADVRTFNNATNTWSNAGTNTTSNTAFGLFIRGLSTEVTGLNYTSGPTALNFELSGTLNGNSVTYTPSNTSNSFVVGNPYAAPVNTQALTGGVAAPYAVYQIPQGSNVAAQRTRAGSWVPAGSNSNLTNTIPMLGALAYTPNTLTPFNITPSDLNLVGTAAENLFRTNETVIEQIGLSIEQNGMLLDRVYLRQQPTNNQQLQKFKNDVTNFYILTANNNQLSINSKQNLLGSQSLGITSNSGNYTLLVNHNNLPENITATLIDKYLHTETVLTPTTQYSFSISSDTASQGNNRFEVLFTKTKIVNSQLPTATSNGFKANVIGTISQSNTINLYVQNASNNKASVTLRDAQGRILSSATVTNGNSTITAPASAGMYFVEINDGNSKIVEKIMR